MSRSEDQKPTRIAEAYFQAVVEQGMHMATRNQMEPRDHAYLHMKTAEGLQQLAVGVRATYLLLEEVKELLRRQNAPPSGRS